MIRSGRLSQNNNRYENIIQLLEKECQNIKKRNSEPVFKLRGMKDITIRGADLKLSRSGSLFDVITARNFTMENTTIDTRDNSPPTNDEIMFYYYKKLEDYFITIQKGSQNENKIKKDIVKLLNLFLDRFPNLPEYANFITQIKEDCGFANI